MFWKPTEALLGDVASTVVALAEGLKGYKCDPEWIKNLREQDRVKESKNRLPTFYFSKTCSNLEFISFTI